MPQPDPHGLSRCRATQPEATVTAWLAVTLRAPDTRFWRIAGRMSSSACRPALLVARYFRYSAEKQAGADEGAVFCLAGYRTGERVLRRRMQS